VPQAYQRDGTIFLTRTAVLQRERSFYGQRCAALVLPPDEALNVDGPEDWDEAERRLARSGPNVPVASAAERNGTPDTKESKHRQFLASNVFQVQTKWPHFHRLLEDVAFIAEQMRPDQTAVCLERAYVYGGHSLFAPLFPRGKFISVDCQTETAAERGGYQKGWLDHPDCVCIPANVRAPVTATTLPDNCADVLLVPNVVHHVRDQEGMFAEFARLLKPGGTGYIFEALLRELHQVPDDYLRYTPWGFETILRRHGLQMTDWKPAGGPFEAIAYCWVQALQYLPPEQRRAKERWFFDEHFPQLMALDRAHPTNLVRSHTSFPIGYGVFFKKPYALGDQAQAPAA
jgi:SAM-dependent methyltransferase